MDVDDDSFLKFLENTMEEDQMDIDNPIDWDADEVIDEEQTIDFPQQIPMDVDVFHDENKHSEDFETQMDIDFDHTNQLEDIEMKIEPEEQTRHENNIFAARPSENDSQLSEEALRLYNEELERLQDDMDKGIIEFEEIDDEES